MHKNLATLHVRQVFIVLLGLTRGSVDGTQESYYECTRILFTSFSGTFASAPFPRAVPSPALGTCR